jgi:drug/metabolite transporter (DMT)-like permease
MATPVLYLILRLKKIRVTARRSDIIVIVPASIILGGHFIIQALGLVYTTATNTAWLIATTPVFIAAASYFFLKEKLTPVKIVGVIVATIGVILLVSGGRLNSLDWLTSVGDWIILSSCITWTIYTTITRNISRRLKPLPLLFLLLILPTILLPLYVVSTTSLSKFAQLPLSIFGVLIFLGVFTLALAHWLWLEGLSRKGTANVGVYLYFEPVVTTLVAIPILGENLTIFAVFGAILILTGVYLVERRQV